MTVPKLPKLKPVSLAAPAPYEHDIQAAFIRLCRLAEKTNLPLLQLGFAVPNAAKRSKAVAARMLAEGMRAGVPDYMLPVPCGAFVGLAIEFKRPKTGRTTEAQDDYIDKLTSVGWLVVVCTCPLAAFRTVQDYLRVGCKALPARKPENS
ncbi:VRR-NUC domain-containing protein [Collimonas humicola]|uniref:VRR-NUC domain-containing protein n=1 Tax=Collimonas humicola TaxID=2825886 RepID=UPI001B8C9A72|nr:VRR-NUC domain-containing protein [Collimonas humicola]